MQFIKQSGVTGIPLLLLTVVIIGLIGFVIVGHRRRDVSGPLFAILFWGFTAAVLGFLGQCAGLYNALVAISGADELSPQVISQGFAQSFSTTLWGGGLLLLAGLAWFVLRLWTKADTHHLNGH